MLEFCPYSKYRYFTFDVENDWLYSVVIPTINAYSQIEKFTASWNRLTGSILTAQLPGWSPSELVSIGKRNYDSPVDIELRRLINIYRTESRITTPNIYLAEFELYKYAKQKLEGKDYKTATDILSSDKDLKYKSEEISFLVQMNHRVNRIKRYLPKAEVDNVFFYNRGYAYVFEGLLPYVDRYSSQTDIYDKLRDLDLPVAAKVLCKVGRWMNDEFKYFHVHRGSTPNKFSISIQDNPPNLVDSGPFGIEVEDSI